MVTYRVAPGYDCTREKFQLVLEHLEALKTDPFDSVPLPDPVPIDFMDDFEECLEGWQSGRDELAIVVCPEEPCIRMNCSGGGSGRAVKEHHRKAVIARLWHFAMVHRINLEITSG